MGERLSPFSEALSSSPARYRDGRASGRAYAVPGAEAAETLIVPVMVDGGDVAVVSVGTDAFTVRETPADYLRRVLPGIGGRHRRRRGVAWPAVRPRGTGGSAVGGALWSGSLPSRWAAPPSSSTSPCAMRPSVEQFGRAIGSFQAVSHQLADLYADVELARSAVEWAAERLDTGQR
jgi:hypothetical protein